MEEQKESDRKYWRKVLARVLNVIKFPSSRGLAFCGSSELVGSPQNGNFLGILELLTGYDTFLAEHIQKKVNKSEGHVSYFSSTVCKEFIDTIATKVLDNMISEIKQAKYYSVSVDSTPDITNVDQLTIILGMFYLMVPWNDLSSLYPPSDTLVTTWLIYFSSL